MTGPPPGEPAAAGALLDGDKVRRLRLAAGHTERGLARHIGTSPLRLRRLEAGQGHEQVTLGLLVRLADALGCTPAGLLARSVPDGPGTRTSERAAEPSRALTLAEARALYRVLRGDHRLAGRGPHGTAQRHLLATGVLDVGRPDPEHAANVTLSHATAAELGL